MGVKNLGLFPGEQRKKVKTVAASICRLSADVFSLLLLNVMFQGISFVWI